MGNIYFNIGAVLILGLSFGFGALAGAVLFELLATSLKEIDNV